MVSKHFKRGHLNHTQQLDLIKEICQSILSRAPQGWKKVIYRSDAVIDHSSSKFQVHDAYEKNIAGWGPNTIGPLLDNLRAGMYREGEGTWFSIKFTIIRPGNFQVEYNYNEDPHILFPTAWGYTNDLKYFPRNEEHTPAWLQQKLSEEPRMQSE